MIDHEATARTLLASAGLSMSAEEEERLVTTYGTFRERVDALYDIVPDTAEPALDFNPAKSL